jgi:Rps23 Pro-64 3,4-dihydroxylase Tpa1-like proline 4-hydroxylase
MIIDKQKFLKDGYYVGNISNFLLKSDINDIKEKINKVKDYYENNKEEILYRYMFHSDENYEHDIKVSEIESRNEIVKNNNYKVVQKWFWFNHGEFINYFDNVASKIYKNFYENEIDLSRLQSNFTVFEKTDFIEPHTDGFSLKRLFVILIYLNDETDYANSGGELVLTNNGVDKLEVEPTFGNFAILDFTKNNINHSVNEVKNDFKRLSFISFVHEK